MKYKVKTLETELWYRYYLVEANSSESAGEKLKNFSCIYGEVSDYDEEFLGTEEQEIIEIEPYEISSKND